MTNVGLIGFGLSGRMLHTPLILAAGMRIVAVATSRTNEVADVLPGAHVVASDEELLLRNDVDLVVITTPNQLHIRQALAALRAGKHVVVDKPLCVHAGDADQLMRTAHGYQLRLAVFHNRRWDSDFLTLARLIDEDKLGAVVAFHARWDRYRPGVADRWREQDHPGSGLLYDLGSHLIDQALCLFGRPEWVQADVFRQRSGAQADDGFEVWMGKGRLRISLGASSLAADDRFRYRILGERATFTKCGRDPQEARLRVGVDPSSAGFGDEPTEDFGYLTHGDDQHRETVNSATGCWLTFYEAMRRSIESGSQVPVSAATAKVTIELIEAALQSSRDGRRVMLC